MKNKMKTRKSIAKRFKLSASGKLKYKKQGLRHILTKKASKRKRQLGKGSFLPKVEKKRFSKILSTLN